ncbi:site-specific DNA-methyltransferase [Streptomyces sp. SAJ15]|uniref:DNA-methyltransferase n=1 Tax=Streptomyces sp. SAJ15 TaxID=2011095 RepID=UPI00135E1798|nr:site-specific DNA-methyltransferase [Streptomyces sp. SAJ15]TVL89807.1 site-specific DNA-methyltransferase [Streptomyces sp. SAJ15]
MTEPYYRDEQVTLLLGDALEQLRTLPDGAVDCIVTSPPYFGLRDYGTPGQYGLEASPAEYVETMRAVFAEARRVLADDGTLWLNLGDSYSSGQGALNTGFNDRWHGEGNSGQRKQEKGRPSRRRDGAEAAAARRAVTGLPAKNLLMVPERVAMALQDDGWTLRNKIVWHKPNAMPESVRDRLTARHEHLFLFAKQPRYYFDLDAIREPTTGGAHARSTAANARWIEKTRTENLGVSGAPSKTLGALKETRNPGDVWSIATKPYPSAHFAVMPIDLPLRCIKAGCRPGGTVLDPFSGSGTTGAAARQLGRKYVGIDLNPAYHELAKKRFAQGMLDFGGAA